MSTVLAGEALTDTAHPRPRRGLILANGAALALAYAIPRLFTLLSAVVAARALGVQGFGWYATAGADSRQGAMVAMLGAARGRGIVVEDDPELWDGIIDPDADDGGEIIH